MWKKLPAAVQFLQRLYCTYVFASHLYIIPMINDFLLLKSTHNRRKQRSKERKIYLDQDLSTKTDPSPRIRNSEP
ncbi:hypothetical protein V6N13_093766 [Hibiscus sabdariffa]